jgi:hypothetical protein
MAIESGNAETRGGQQLEVHWTSDAPRGLSDSQLLRRYAEARGRGTESEAAFRELVGRHGPMVLGICRQILRHHHDADVAATTGSVAVWAHWPASRAEDSGARQRAVPALAPADAATPTDRARLAPQPAVPAPHSRQSGGDVRLADCPAGEPDCFPE